MKRYLGDAVYVDADDRGLVLTTEDGISATNTIVLEPSTFLHLMEYVRAEHKGLTRTSAIILTRTTGEPTDADGPKD